MPFHPLRVAAVERLCDDAAALTFLIPDNLAVDYEFAAGQFLTVRREVDGVEERRSYSICAPVGEPPRIGVRALPGGAVSPWLVQDVRPGDVIDVATPDGRFRVEPGLGGHHLLIAAGSGITPVLSIATTLLREATTSGVTLVYGNRTAASVMFADEVADLKDRYGPRLHLIHVLSREPRDVDLLSGRLEPPRLRQILTTLVRIDDVNHAWLCGPLALVEGAREVLTELGVAPANVHAELFFVGEEPTPHRHEAAPVGDATQVTVVADGRAVVVAVAPGETVLDAAQKVRADLPFACKGGVCGTCRAHVRDGEVEMRRNFALAEEEVAAGFVLTCQTHPRSDDVTLDFDR